MKATGGVGEIGRNFSESGMFLGVIGRLAVCGFYIGFYTGFN